MTNQQKPATADYVAAAKRLRDEERMFVVSPVIDECRQVLVSRMLRELDETPITENDGPWLTAIGGRRRGNCFSFGGIEVWLFDKHFREPEDSVESVLEAGRIVNNPTRGELISACRALRIPLNEA